MPSVQPQDGPVAPSSGATHTIRVSEDVYTFYPGKFTLSVHVFQRFIQIIGKKIAACSKIVFLNIFYKVFGNLKQHFNRLQSIDHKL